MSVQAVNKTQEYHKLEIYVFPSNCIVTKLAITALKNGAQQGMTQAEIDANSGKWEGNSQKITKPTVLSLEIPADATSYDIVPHTEKATQRTLSCRFGFQSTAFQVYEISYNGRTRNEIMYEKLDLAKSKLPQNADKQTITLVKSKDSSTISAPTKDPLENKVEKKKE